MTKTEANRLCELTEKVEGFAPRKGRVRNVGGGRHRAIGDTPGPGWTLRLLEPAEKYDTTDPLNPTPTGDYHVLGVEDYDLDGSAKRARLTTTEQDELDALRAKLDAEVAPR